MDVESYLQRQRRYDWLIATCASILAIVFTLLALWFSPLHVYAASGHHKAYCVKAHVVQAHVVKAHSYVSKRGKIVNVHTHTVKAYTVKAHCVGAK
jgi:hypothetical protein